MGKQTIHVYRMPRPTVLMMSVLLLGDDPLWIWAVGDVSEEPMPPSSGYISKPDEEKWP